MILREVKFDLDVLKVQDYVRITREETMHNAQVNHIGLITKIDGTALCMISVNDDGTTFSHTFVVEDFTRESFNPLQLEKYYGGLWKTQNREELE